MMCCNVDREVTHISQGFIGFYDDLQCENMCVYVHKMRGQQMRMKWQLCLACRILLGAQSVELICFSVFVLILDEIKCEGQAID